METSKKDIHVLLTGFQPFNNYNVNPSWEAVKALGKEGLGVGMEHVKLHCVELPVLYKYVSKVVPKLWKSIKPQLTVHVGVSSEAAELTLEQQAHNSMYLREDSNDYVPPDGFCIPGGPDLLVSEIDMQQVCQKMKAEHTKAVVSFDPGLFLCDFTYYHSLHIDKKRSAFVHVPPQTPITLPHLTIGLKVTVIAMLKQLKLV